MEQAVQRVHLRDRVLSWFESTTSPATVKDVALIFGTGAIDALEGLVFDGLVQRRKTFTKGRPYQFLAAGRAWPALEHTLADSIRNKAQRDAQRKREGKGVRSIAGAIAKLEHAVVANDTVPEAQRECYRPWPFYDVKFLPYVKYMDAKMARRYRRTAKIYGDKIPGE